MVRVFLLALLLQLLGSLPVMAAKCYMVTEQQLTMLESNLTASEQVNRNLIIHLTALHGQLKNRDDLLANANQYLDRFARSQRRKIRWLKFQRNALIVGMAVAVVVKRK